MDKRATSLPGREELDDLLNDLTLDQFHALIYDHWTFNQRITRANIRAWRKHNGLPVPEGE